MLDRPSRPAGEPTCLPACLPACLRPRRSADPRFNGLQTLKVEDARPLSGDSMAAARVVPGLPFADTDTSSRFTNKYTADGDAEAPGVSGAGLGGCCRALNAPGLGFGSGSAAPRAGGQAARLPAHPPSPTGAAARVPA